MVRSSRVLVLVAVALVVACGGESASKHPKATPLVAMPSSGDAVVPFPVAVVRGTAAANEALTLRVTRGAETYAFVVEGGLTLAFLLDRAAGQRPVVLPGLPAMPSPAECRAEIKSRLAATDRAFGIREGRDAEAFLIDLPDEGDGDAIAEVIASLTAGRDLRFLIEVRPRERYHTGPDEMWPPRLEAPPYPWPEDSAEAFDRYKEAEVARWREARAAGLPYAPSREDLLVLPRHGSPAEAVDDFAVFEWPAEPAYRIDGRALRDPRRSMDPATGKPVVLFRVAGPHQPAFEAWTRENVGLPLAVVLDWEVRSTPILRDALRDNVMITLGQGAWAKLQAEADALTRQIQSGGDALPVGLVASLARWGDGAFEALVPLPDEQAVTIEVTVAGRTERRTIRQQPLAEATLPYAVDAVLGLMRLGSLDAEQGAVRLRGLAPAATDHLAQILAADSSIPRRRAAAALLGRVDRESEVARQALLVALQDPEPALRVGAGDALTFLAPAPEVAPAILEAMATLETEGRVVLVRALGRMGPEATGALEGLLALAARDEFGVTHEAQYVLASDRWSEDARIRAAVASPDPAIRAAAIASVGFAGDVANVSWLVEQTKDEDGGVRVAATAALIPFAWAPLSEHLAPHLDALFERMQDEEPAVRQNVAQILGEFGGEALPRLLALVEHERPEVRRSALAALTVSEYLRADALSVLRDALGDADLFTRLAAVSPYLKHGGHPSDALVVVEEGLADPYPASVNRKTALTLVLTTGLEPAEAWPRVIALLEDPHEDVRALAALVLVRDGKADDRATKIAEEVKRDPKHPLHGFTTLGR